MAKVVEGIWVPRLRFESLLKIRECLIEPALLHEDITDAHEAVDKVIGFQIQNLVKTSEGGVFLPLAAQGLAQVDVGRHVAGLQLNRAPEVMFGFREIYKVVKHNA